MIAMLAADIGEQLHADADAQEGSAAFDNGAPQRLAHAGQSVETAATVGESADPRQDNVVGLVNVGRVGGDANFGCETSPRATPARKPWRRSADCPSHSRRSPRSRRVLRGELRVALEEPMLGRVAVGSGDDIALDKAAAL